MNVVLLTGRAGSKSVPNKNVHPILGRPLAWYAMHAARQAKRVDAIYVTTDCEQIKSISRDLEIGIVDRPPELARDVSELVDAISHAMSVIPHQIDVLITMHCNYAGHRPGLVDACIEKLENNPEADSCVTAIIDNSAHPFRTRTVDQEGFLSGWFDVPADASSNRQQLSPCFILDGAARAIRVATCFPPNGLAPFAYLGRRVLPVVNEGGTDVHGMADIVATEAVLRAIGWTESEEPAESR